MNNKERIVLASAIDNNYAQHLGAMLASIFENKGGEEIVYYVIDGGISEKNKKRLKKVAKKYNFELIFKEIDPSVFDNLKITYHFNRANYFNLIMPDILFGVERKVIYLDVDIVVLKSLKDLWQSDLEGHTLGAVIDYEGNPIDNYKDIGINSPNDYFNSGVIYIDIDKWKEFNLTKKVIEYVESNHEKITYADQEGLNAVLMGNWKKLPKKYNYTLSVHPNFRFFDKVEIPKDVVVMHYASFYSKPWLFTTNYSKKLYRKYLLKTPWRFNLYTDLKHLTFKKIYKKYKELFSIALNQQTEFFDLIKKIKNNF